MKNISILILSLFFANAVFAETNPKPEKIYRITEIQKSGEYYIEQYELWKAEVEKDKTNEDAWYNYFVAARYSNIIGKKSNDLEKIVSDIEKAIPNTFTSHFVNCWQYTWAESYFENLQAAYEIDPNRYETYHSFVSYYEVNGNAAKAQEFAQKWYESGMMSNIVLSWSYNLLMSVESDGILLTHGDNDTYYPWVLQHVQGVQRGVKVVNIHLLQVEDYQNKIFSDLGLPKFSKKLDDFKAYDEYQVALINHLFDNSKRPVYLANSMHPDIKKAFKKDLYVTGLASLYCKKNIDNLAIVKNNIEHNFITDYLKINLVHDISQGSMNYMNMMYLESYLLLYKHYQESGETGKAMRIKETVTKIGKDANRLNDVKNYFGQNDARPHNYPDLDLKELQKKYLFIKSSSNLWAAETELTNADYETFLMSLVKNKDFETLAICKSEKTEWKSLLNEIHQDLSDDVIFKHGHPDEELMPVQNISHEAAVEYCKWLTEAYNQSNYKKKKFKKVLFRLPTEAEWELAAQGGHNLAKYPWGGYYYRNGEGCYLFNSNVNNGEPCKDCDDKGHPANDGGFFTVYASSYFPNDFGLYNMCGNVAEMIATKGVAKGGSWNDKPENSEVTSKQNYTSPSPSIGARIFMEVVEE
ncbi:MAG: formylglycine-generating enzyme family protein [Saprospiraceae bacterium]